MNLREIKSMDGWIYCKCCGGRLKYTDYLLHQRNRARLRLMKYKVLLRNAEDDLSRYDGPDDWKKLTRYERAVYWYTYLYHKV